MLYNTADMERGGPGDGDTVAILEGTQLCSTRQLRDLLPTLGGVSALLPPLAQLGTEAPHPSVARSLRACQPPCMLSYAPMMCANSSFQASYVVAKEASPLHAC